MSGIAEAEGANGQSLTFVGLSDKCTYPGLARVLAPPSRECTPRRHRDPPLRPLPTPPA